jgi:DNA-binding NarL/FixJ family response regulator
MVHDAGHIRQAMENIRIGRIRVLVIEQSRLLRDGMRSMLNAQTDMRVVGAIDGESDILAKIDTTRPQVILVGGGSTRFNAHSIIQLIREMNPGAKIVCVGLSPSQSDITELIAAGASGFILKGATVKEVLESIRAVGRGEKVLPATMTSSLFSVVAALSIKKQRLLATDAIRMTRREYEIMAQIAQGASNKEIASRLHISTHTVKSHVHNIMEKLALHSRTQIAKIQSAMKN